MYGSTVKPETEPAPVVARRPGASAAVVASALVLLAGATLARRAASPRGADASLAAAAGALHHDDEYQPASANATLAYEWRVYEAAIATFRAQCCARLGPERCS